jgi:hypothetical protein
MLLDGDQRQVRSTIATGAGLCAPESCVEGLGLGWMIWTAHKLPYPCS